jgi:hypothetical protein
MQLLLWAQNINLATLERRVGKCLARAAILRRWENYSPGSADARWGSRLCLFMARLGCCLTSWSTLTLHDAVLPCDARPAPPISSRGSTNWPCLHSTKKKQHTANHMAPRVLVCLSPDVSAPLQSEFGDSIPPRRRAFQPLAAQTRIRFLVIAPGFDY